MMSAAAAAAFSASVQQIPGALSADGQYVVIEATARDGDGAALLHALHDIGAVGGSSFGAMASGTIAVSQLSALLSLEDLAFAREDYFSAFVGKTTTQADKALHTDTVRATLGFDGTGMTIGVLSDSFNALGGMSKDISTGDLPANTTVLYDSKTGTDEGRGMAQLVHDLAPGANILFATADNNQVDFANHILALANAGAQVIVDDIIYFAEPAFQDGIVAQAVAQVTAMGIPYFSSAGNDGNHGFEADWVNSGFTATFGSGSSKYTETLAKLTTGATPQYLPVTISSGASITFVLQWDQPAASASPGHGSANDVDLYLYNNAHTSVLARSEDNNIGGDPVEIIQYTNNGATATFNLAVGLYSGATPGHFRLMALDNGEGVSLGASSLNQSTSTAYGHESAPGAVAVAASYYGDTPAYGTSPPIVEDFSSWGPTKILFDTAGNRLATPIVRQVPQITSVDGGNTTFFGSDYDGDGFPNFFGTSAAAPDAAAVALLMLQANKGLTPADVLALMEDSAIDMGTPGFDIVTGAGLI